MPFQFKKYLLSLSLLSSTAFAALEENVEVQLKDPSFKQGVLQTTNGGVITSKEIRIQAQNIQYTNKLENGEKVQTLSAEGNLLFEYGGKFFVGSRLEYDLIKNKGTLFDGRTSDGFWFVGGDQIELKGNGNYAIYGAFVTTCENNDPTWSINSKSISLSDSSLLSASNIQFKFFHIPLFWIPSFKSNLKLFSNPPIRYKIVWDKGLGPRVSMRYRVFSWEDLSLFLRLDYRLTKGPGAAFESEYFSKDERTTFVTRSYGAYDKEVYDQHGWKRYRLQGLFTHQSEDKKTLTRMSYDKYHDLKMISDFPSSDFEINTQKKNQLLVYHQEEIAFASLKVEPRLNTFESLNQKLPVVKVGIRPMSIGSSGIISENYANVGYLDYVYAHDLINTYPALHETHAARLETRNRIYRPFSKGPVHFTPSVGVIGIFYNNNPQKKAAGQGAITYGGNLNSSFYRNYPSMKHTFQPYIDYTGLSKPKVGLNQHYIFTIDDGLYQINSMKVGLLNTFFFKNSAFFLPALSLDLYSYAFFNDKTFSKTFPKSYATLTVSQPSYLLQTNTCWNFQENILDFCNVKTDFTVNEHAAFSFELRHRSRYDWRKADRESFILDMAESISNLVDSPLSDKRNTFLSQLQVRISPKWSCHFSSHYGWGRITEPSYNSFKFDLLTLLASHWRIKFSYTHTTNDDRVSTQIQLLK